MTVRRPVPLSLCDEPLLGSLVLLDLAAAIAANALRAHYVEIEGDFAPDEGDELTMVRALAEECDIVCNILRDYRRCLLARADHQDDWPF